MILGGDEFCRTQQGNNNAYCQDNEISWFDWRLLEKNQDIFRFAREMIHFRRRHPALRRHSFLVGREDGSSAFGDITWHGRRAGEPDWSYENHFLAFTLWGDEGSGLSEEDDDIYVALNMGTEAVTCELPSPRPGRRWYRVVDTSLGPPEDIRPAGEEVLLENQRSYRVHARTSVVLVGK